MTRLFLAASVLFAAALSETGGAREIIRRGFAGELDLVVSGFVLEEARRNLAAKAPAALPAFEAFVGAAPFVVVDATRHQAAIMARHTAVPRTPRWSPRPSAAAPRTWSVTTTSTSSAMPTWNGSPACAS